MAEADEDDYMSNIFVEEVKPHKSMLCKPKPIARQRELENNRNALNSKNRIQPRHVVEHEARTQGLATAIANDNPGFKLLQKMGYQAGKGLGVRGEGRAEPVPITVKSGRTGLGRDAVVKEAQTRKRNMLKVVKAKRAKVEKVQHKQFRDRMREKFNFKQVEQDLYKSQKVCHHLDQDGGIKIPGADYFWPTSMTDIDDDEEDDYEDLDEIPSNEKLVKLTNYLRNQYFYCIWCGHRFVDKSDLEQNCPGDTAACHDDDW